MKSRLSPSRPILRYHGGKWLLAPWILSFFPEHKIYTEAYGGGASVLLQKWRSYAEVYNDLDGEIVNLFRVIRDRGHELLRAIELTPFARAEFEASSEPSQCNIEQARRTLVRSYMGFGGNLVRPTKSGRIEKTGFRNYSKKNRRSIPAGDWRTWPASLPVIIERMRGVIIEQRPAVEIIQEHDGPQTLHYVDPTYVRSTRSPKAAYRFEMTDADHESLSAILQACKGLVLLSGYGCPLYDRLYQDWVCHRRKANADGARARTECLWLNPAAAKWNKTLL